jgi:glycosyltransferase involved in cell wall biosynthesis
MATAVRNGLNGYVDTRIETLIERMNLLLSDAAEAHRLSRGARTYAAERFNIKRFVRDWEEAFACVMRTSRPVQSLLAR